jgi:hypothetical protein
VGSADLSLKGRRSAPPDENQVHLYAENVADMQDAVTGCSAPVFESSDLPTNTADSRCSQLVRRINDERRKKIPPASI